MKEILVGFSDLVSAQVFWTTLDDPTQYHIARIHNQSLDGDVLGYLVVKNKEI
jgi:hypothetical protein